MSTSGGGKTINQFCQDWQLSRAFFYLMKGRGEGPEIMQVGGVQRISFEAEQAWARKRQAATNAAARQAAKAAAIADKRGKRAA